MIGLLRKIPLLLCAQICAGSAYAQTFDVSLQIPRLDVAEYHRPYVALWVAAEDQSVVADLAVLYDVEMASNEGQKWLKDLRQWWRRSGRTLTLPVDGMTGATRPPGAHDFKLAGKVANVPAGQYRLVIEAVREVGGRELIEIPFQWPPEDRQTLSAQGSVELGRAVLTLAP